MLVVELAGYRQSPETRLVELNAINFSPSIGYLRSSLFI